VVLIFSAAFVAEIRAAIVAAFPGFRARRVRPWGASTAVILAIAISASKRERPGP
jgi:hypothetical protein